MDGSTRKSFGSKTSGGCDVLTATSWPTRAAAAPADGTLGLVRHREESNVWQ